MIKAWIVFFPNILALPLQVKFVVLVNCGGTVDIVELLEPEESVIFFLLDSHRPTDLCNVFSSSQVNKLSFLLGDQIFFIAKHISY